MADLGALTGNPIGSLYPQPPQPQRNASDPMAAIGALANMVRLKQGMAAMQSQQAWGNLILSKAKPDGTIDVGDLINSAHDSNDPNIAYGATNYINPVLEVQARQYANAAAAVKSKVDQFAPLFNAWATLPDNASADDVRNRTTAASTFLPKTISSSDVNGLENYIVNDKQGPKHGVDSLRLWAIGPENVNALVPGPPDPVTGQPTTITRGQGIMRAGAGQTGAPGFPSAPPPGFDTSVKAMQQAQSRQGSFAQEMQPWNEALRVMEPYIKEGNTLGPGSGGRQALESFVHTLSPTAASLLGIDPQKIGDYDQIKKYLTNALQARASQFGVHSNEGLATASAGTPNVEISDLGGVPLVKAMIGVRRMEHAQSFLAQQAGPGGFLAEAGRVSPMLDPHGFEADLADKDQLANYKSTLKTPAERNRFNASYAAGLLSGAIPNKDNIPTGKLVSAVNTYFRPAVPFSMQRQQNAQ